MAVEGDLRQRVMWSCMAPRTRRRPESGEGDSFKPATRKSHRPFKRNLGNGTTFQVQGMLDIPGFFVQLTDSVSQHNDRAVFGGFYGYSMNNKSLFLAMEYFPLRDLKRHIEARTVDEEEAKKIVHDLLMGLKIMHAEGIVHRDLKPEVRWYIFISLPFGRFVVRGLSFSHITNRCQNIFVAGKPPESCWSVKIADFGISKRIPPEGEWNLTLWRGTRYYIAPEVQGLIDPCQENPGAMDMWSLGIIVYFSGD